MSMLSLVPHLGHHRHLPTTHLARGISIFGSRLGVADAAVPPSPPSNVSVAGGLPLRPPAGLCPCTPALIAIEDCEILFRGVVKDEIATALYSKREPGHRMFGLPRSE